MNFKKIVSAVSALAISVSAFAGLAVTASAADVVYNVDYTAAGAVNDGWASTSSNKPTITVDSTNGLLHTAAQANSKARDYVSKKTISEAGYNGIVTIDTDVTWIGNTSGNTASNIYTYFGVEALDGTQVITIGADGQNKKVMVNGAIAASSDTARGGSWHINIVANVATGGVDYTITSGNSTVDSGTVATTASNVAVLTTGLSSTTKNTAVEQTAIKNITVTQEDVVAETAGYTVKYVNQDDNNAEIKESASRTGVVGVAPVLLESDTANIAATESTPKYVYVSDDASEKSITSDGTTVVTVVYREAAKYNYTVNASTGAAIASGNLYEGDSATVAYPQYQLVDGTLYEAAKHNDSAKQYNWTFTPDADNYVLTIPYSATAITNVVYLTEGEDIQGISPRSGTNSNNVSIRSSNSNAGYAAEDLTITTLPAGEYKLVGVLFSGSKDNDYTFNFELGDKTYGAVAKGSSNWIGFESEPMLITEESALVLKASGSGTALLDYVYVVKTGEYEAPATPSVSAESAVKEGYITFKGVIANAATVDKAGFGFINAQELGNDLKALWTTNAVQNNTFGAAIEQQKGATHSAFYAVPYIVVNGNAVFGNVVASDWND